MLKRCLLTLLALVVCAPTSHGDLAFRPPAVPLVTHDPYLSIWCEADRLTDTSTRHWTRRPHSLVSLIRVDGKPYRLMGDTPKDVPALPQVGLQVLPTRTTYDFDGSHVHVSLTFLTAALPTDLEALTRPLSYITWQVKSVDGVPHNVALYDSVSSQLAVNRPEQEVAWAREQSGPLTALRVGTEEQPVLQTMGDDTRIDWGYAYLAAPRGDVNSAIGGSDALLRAFADTGQIPDQVDARMPRATNDDQPVLAMELPLGRVGKAPVSRHVMVAYDEVYSILYFGRRLRPYWRRNGATAGSMLQAAERDYRSLVRRCAEFDQQLMADLTRQGGERYAQVAALAYRQFLAACGIAADANKQPLMFTKENTSNGDIATVDVFFPMDPALIFLSPSLAKATLVPVLEYAASSHWKFPNAPHDLGTYPVVMGRDDGGEGMPVEESGNMLILCDAIAQEDGNAGFVSPWWPQLTQWAKYLEQYGLDPEDQLCTDDFMGHLAHNANLSVKAILGLAAYGDLCRLRGDQATADRYMEMARRDAQHWVQVADEGDHSLLAFDKPRTWSQKYNLVWDRILGFHVFPPSVAQKEIAYYKTVMQPYGVPLDSRTRLTKTDWSYWSATLADGQADFVALTSPIWDYLDQTTARDPLADSYITDNVKSGGMHARPVVGGVFIKMLADRDTWMQWAHRDHTRVGNWAPLPKTPPPPRVTEVVPSSRQAPVTWRYTTSRPQEGWTQPGFDDSGWNTGQGPFGTTGTPGIEPRTVWNTDDIWLRRTFVMPDGGRRTEDGRRKGGSLELFVYHDEDVEVYVNGVPAGSESGFLTAYKPLAMRPTALAQLRPGARVTLAVHCHQTTGGQGVDVGIVEVRER